MTAQTPIKIYVGTQREQLLAYKILEYSILQHTAHPVEIVPLDEAIAAAQLTIPLPAQPALRPRTPFSFQRFTIPALENYQGRAIYLDSDMQVFRDIAELWHWDFAGADLLAVHEPADSGRHPQFSVMVLDCEQLHWDINELVRELEQGRWSYEQFVFQMAPARQVRSVLPTEWNDLERYTPGKTALTHYTDMRTQPWLSTANPLAGLWCRELLSALQSGFIPLDLVEQEVQLGHIRPSLLEQVKHGIVEPGKLPAATLRHDRLNFVPPHALENLPKFIRSESFLWNRFLIKTYAGLRYLANR